VTSVGLRPHCVTPKRGARNHKNPAELHLSLAGNCSDNRNQLFPQGEYQPRLQNGTDLSVAHVRILINIRFSPGMSNPEE